jgi:hypothetical protein
MNIELEKDFDWSSLEPDDGYFAEVVNAGEALAELIFGFKVHGKVVLTEKLSSIKAPTHQEVGELKRRCIFYRGLAEYLNAGGSDADYLCKKALEVSVGQLVFPGWDYYDHGLNTNGNDVHEFVNQENPLQFVRWVRNEFIDESLNEQEILDEQYTGVYGAAAADGFPGHIA